MLETKTWIANTSFNAAASWSPAGVPVAGDDVVIDTAGTFTLDVSTPSLNSLTISDAGAILAVGGRTLNVNFVAGSAISATAGTITIGGGTVNATGGMSLGSTALVSGFGTVNANLTGTGAVQASTDVLDLKGSVASGVVLEIDSASPSTLKIDGAATSAAAIGLTSANQTLEVGSTGSLVISAAHTVTDATIKVDGTLTDSSGIVLANGTLSGSGTLAANTNVSGNGTISLPISTAGSITASGGILHLDGVTSGRTLAVNADGILTIGAGGTTTDAAIAIAVGGRVDVQGDLTINAVQTVNNAGGPSFNINGGTLTDSTGIVIGSSGLIYGSNGGTIDATILALARCGRRAAGRWSSRGRPPAISGCG